MNNKIVTNDKNRVSIFYELKDPLCEIYEKPSVTFNNSTTVHPWDKTNRRFELQLPSCCWCCCRSLCQNWSNSFGCSSIRFVVWSWSLFHSISVSVSGSISVLISRAGRNIESSCPNESAPMLHMFWSSLMIRFEA